MSIASSSSVFSEHNIPVHTFTSCSGCLVRSSGSIHQLSFSQISLCQHCRTSPYLKIILPCVYLLTSLPMFLSFQLCPLLTYCTHISEVFKVMFIMPPGPWPYLIKVVSMNISDQKEFHIPVCVASHDDPVEIPSTPLQGAFPCFK